MTEAADEKLELIRSSLRLCPDFPKKGIIFVDMFGVFANAKAHQALIDVILNHVRSLPQPIDAVVGLEARGFVFGPQIALSLQIPFVPARKLGKLPGKVAKIEYDLEYGKDTIEMQVNVLKPGTRVMIVDDLLATGGTLGAAQALCAKLGCEVVDVLVVIELTDLGGRKKLTNADHIKSLLQFSTADLETIVAQHADRILPPKDV